MPLIGTCPECGAKAPMSAFAQGPDAGRAMEQQVSRLPWPVATRLIPYLRLHAPRDRALNWNKAGRLISELADLTTAGVITWEREKRTGSADIWASAMDKATTAAERGELDLPLDGHGWLRKVAWSEAGKAGREAEKKREAIARGETPIGQSQAHRPFTPEARTTMTDELRDLMSQRNSLRNLERGNPGVHLREIERVEEKIAKCMRADQPIGDDA